MLDLLVVGAGLTGLFAAFSAARAGLQVRVIAKGMGATHWHAGTIDVLGYLPNEEAPVVNWKDAIAALPVAHPYRLLTVSDILTGLERFQQVTAEAGLPYQRRGPDGRNQFLPSPVGAARPVYLAPAGQGSGDLAEPQPLVIVGFTGMRDFYPALIAENLREQGLPARHTTLPLSMLSERRDSGPVQLARILDEPVPQTRLAEAVAGLAGPDERIGFPAVLGLRHHSQLVARMESAAGVPVFEIPTLPPSVPGLRLYHALYNQLADMGVRVEIGMEVCGVERDMGQVLWVETETSSRPLRHRARMFLLATGGILGGGIRADHDGTVQETVFDLPLTAPQSRADWLRTRFLDERGHPIFQSGVSVNEELQPVDANGSVVYGNLWAAGSILAHTDPIRERSREGIALATGYAAGQNIAARHI